MGTKLFSHTGALLNPAHQWTDFYKGIDAEGPYYECSFGFDDWQDSDTVPNQMLGKTTLTGGAGGVVSRGLPFQHPLSPNLYCRSAKVRGVGPPVLNANGVPFYSAGFLVDCVFRIPVAEGVFQNADDPFGNQQIDPQTPLLWCTQELDFDTQIVTTPNNQTKWLSDGKLTGLPSRIEIGITIMRLTFHRLPYVPMTKFRTYRGKVNSGVFLNAAAGTVLFPGGTTVREVSTDGSVVQQVAMVFKERNFPWSQTPRPDSGLWDTQTTDGTTPIFSTANLNTLIQI